MIAVHPFPSRPHTSRARRYGHDLAVPPARRTAVRDSAYLRRWISHKAELYNDLLQTIASAPDSH